MKRKHCAPSPNTIDLGIASRCTLGLLQGEIPEPMGFWHRAGISDR